MAYSTDYRQMILKKLEEGSTIRKLSKEFNISTNTIQRWKTHPSRKHRVSKPYKIDNDVLIKDVEQYPDAYHYERAIRLQCTASGICIALQRLGITQKKDTQTPKS